MTNVVTVSAATAAYATEPLRPSARVSGSVPSQETMKARTAEARKADSEQHQELMNVVGPPALALFFLTAGQHRKHLQQATWQQAEEAYLGLRGEEPGCEVSHGDEEISEEDEFEEEQSEILALPAPERFS